MCWKVLFIEVKKGQGKEIRNGKEVAIKVITSYCHHQVFNNYLFIYVNTYTFLIN